MPKFLTTHKIILVFILLISANCNAEEIADVYQIEVLIFENKPSSRANNEIYPEFVGGLDIKNAAILDKYPKNVPESIEALNSLEALDRVGQENVSKIVSSTIGVIENKNLILKNEAQKIDKNRSKRIIEHIGWMQPLANNVKSTKVYITGGENDEEIQALVSVTPRRSQFDLNIDYIYKSPFDNREYRVTRDIKLKKKEAFYLDHPVVGIFIIVSPIFVE